MGILNRLCVCVTQDCTLKLLWTVVKWMAWIPAQQQRPAMSHGLTGSPMSGMAGSEVGKEIKWELGHEYLLWVSKYRGSVFDLFFYPERAHFVSLTFKNTLRL